MKVPGSLRVPTLRIRAGACSHRIPSSRIPTSSRPFSAQFFAHAQQRLRKTCYPRSSPSAGPVGVPVRTEQEVTNDAPGSGPLRVWYSYDPTQVTVSGVDTVLPSL